MEAVASGCATWGVWGRRRGEETVYKGIGGSASRTREWFRAMRGVAVK